MSALPKKVVYLGFDGTLATRDGLVPNVIPALLSLRDAGYAFVVLGGESPLLARRAELLALFASQGVTFADVRAGRDRLALVTADLWAGPLDRARTAVVGAEPEDGALAETLGVKGFRVGPDGEDWLDVARRLRQLPRTGGCARSTRETTVRVAVDLDGDPARGRIATGLGFLDHMLDQLARHGGLRLDVQVAGDLEVDEHHTVEDTALALGEALRQALGDRAGIARYGFTLPMDEALASAALDLSGRPWLAFEGRFARPSVGGLPTELVPHFFQSLAQALGATLHVTVTGENAHHQVEAAFKAVARCLRQAARRTGEAGVPSTKGVL